MKPRNLQEDKAMLKQLRRKKLSLWAERKLIIKLKRAMPHYIEKVAEQERTICRMREELADKRQELSALRLKVSINEDAELKPATKFLENSIFKQWRHMLSEFIELTWELLWDNLPKAAMEITDLQASATTMQQILGYDIHSRCYLRMMVNGKNKKRGYLS